MAPMFSKFSAGSVTAVLAIGGVRGVDMADVKLELEDWTPDEKTAHCAHLEKLTKEIRAQTNYTGILREEIRDVKGEVVPTSLRLQGVQHYPQSQNIALGSFAAPKTNAEYLAAWRWLEGADEATAKKLVQEKIEAWIAQLHVGPTAEALQALQGKIAQWQRSKPRLGLEEWHASLKAPEQNLLKTYVTNDTVTTELPVLHASTRLVDLETKRLFFGSWGSGIRPFGVLKPTLLETGKEVQVHVYVVQSTLADKLAFRAAHTDIVIAEAGSDIPKSHTPSVSLHFQPDGGWAQKMGWGEGSVHVLREDPPGIGITKRVIRVTENPISIRHVQRTLREMRTSKTVAFGFSPATIDEFLFPGENLEKPKGTRAGYQCCALLNSLNCNTFSRRFVVALLEVGAEVAEGLFETFTTNL